MRLICKYIDCVETFGLITPQIQNSICEILAKERKLSSEVLNLFLDRDQTTLSLTNCSGE
jgi:hypothetical protein